VKRAALAFNLAVALSLAFLVRGVYQRVNQNCGFCESPGCSAEPGACTDCCRPEKCKCADSPTHGAHQ
jgi:hypothetical protein